MTKNTDKSKPHGSGTMTWVLLGVTAVVIGVTIYVATSRSTSLPPDRSPQETNRPATGEQVVTAMTKLLAAADLSTQKPALRLAAYQQARDTMISYVNHSPKDVVVRPYLGEVLLRMREGARARKVADELEALAPGSADALWLKGLVLRDANDPQADQYFRQAADSNDARPEILARYGIEMLGRRDLAAAEGYLNRAHQGGARQVPLLCALARFAMEKKQFEDAEKLLAVAVRDADPTPVAWQMLAMAQKEQGKFDDAVASIQEALRILPAWAAKPSYVGPDKGDLLYSLGQARMLQKQNKLAAEAFSEAADFPLIEPQASFHAAQCWYLAGRYSEALKYIDAAEKLLPGEPAVADWKKKIEDAHFPRAATTTSPYYLP